MEKSRIDQLNDFLKASPADPFLNYALAMEYIGRQDDSTACGILEKLAANDPGYSATYYHLGKLYERQGRRDEAAELYRRGIRITREKREQHALSELMSALNELEMED